MTVESGINDGITHDGNDVATNFSFPFKVNTADQVEVILRDVDDNETVLADTLYTVNNQNVEGSGSVDYPVSGSPLAVGEKLTINPKMDYKQLTDLRNQGRFAPETYEDAFDTLMMHIKELRGLINRAVLLKKSSEIIDRQYSDDPVENLMLAWDANGGIQNVTAGSITSPPTTQDNALVRYNGTNGAGIQGSGIIVDDSDNVAGANVVATGATASRDLRDRFATLASPKDYGAVGDGVVDDTAALQAAATAVGADGTLYANGETFLVTSRELVQCNRIGKGFIKIGSTLYPWNNQELDIDQNGIRPYGSSNVSPVDYSHFPVLERMKNGALGCVYLHSKDHGQSDTEAVSLSQAVGGAGNLTINGNYASGGSVTLGAGAGDGTGATRVGITSDENDSGVTFTITGTYQGNPVNFTVTGVNNNTVYSTTSEVLDVITQVSADGACSGDISVGLWMLPSDIDFRSSEDGGQSWSSAFALADGLTAEGTYNYYPTFGVTKEGYTVANYISFDIEEVSKATGTYTIKTRLSKDNGLTWSAAQDVTVNGISPTTTLVFYKKIKYKQDGVLYASAYSADDNFFLTSTDYGVTWAGSVLVNSASPNYDEMAIQFIDNMEAISVARITGTTSAMRQFKTTDGGVTWSIQGDLNAGAIIPDSGGYVSPSLELTHFAGTAYLVLGYTARTSTSAPHPTPDSLIVHYVKAADALAASNNWSVEDIVINGLLAGRSGYQSMYINPVTGQCLIAYGDETAFKTAEVKTIKHNIGEKLPVVLGDITAQDAVLQALRATSLTFNGTDTLDDLKNLTTSTNVVKFQGSTSGGSSDETYSSRVLKYAKIGPLVICEFNVELTSKGSGTPLAGTISLVDLPYSFASVNAAVGSCYCDTRDASISGESVYVRGVASATSATLHHTSGTSDSNVADTEIGATFNIRGSIVYLTND